MRRALLFLLLFLLNSATGEAAYAFGSVYCGHNAVGQYECMSAVNAPSVADAIKDASSQCTNSNLSNCGSIDIPSFANQCETVASPDKKTILFTALGPNAFDSTDKASTNCSGSRGGCTILLTACDVAKPSLASASNIADMDWAGIFQAIGEFEAKLLIAAVVINLVLFLGLFNLVRAHKQRLYILGALTFACVCLSFILPFLGPVMGALGSVIFVGFAVLEHTATVGMYAAGIPFAALLVSKYAPSLFPDLFDQGLPETLRVTSKQIEVVISRSQRLNWLNRVVFMIDARMGMSIEQYSLMRKYRLGRTIVFDSARRERQNELARTHLELAREGKSQTICLWREELRGIFRRLWYLIRALLSFLLGFLFIRITLAKLIKGAHVESRSLDKILAAKNAIERSAGDLKAYLEVAETFDGREDLFEPS